MEAADHNNCTPLMFAVANGDEAVVRRLVKSGANVNAKDRESNGPLDYAINFGQTVMAKLLRDAGAEARQPSDPSDGEGAYSEDEEQEVEPETDQPASPAQGDKEGLDNTASGIATSQRHKAA